MDEEDYRYSLGSQAGGAIKRPVRTAQVSQPEYVVGPTYSSLLLFTSSHLISSSHSLLEVAATGHVGHNGHQRCPLRAVSYRSPEE